MDVSFTMRSMEEVEKKKQYIHLYFSSFDQYFVFSKVDCRVSLAFKNVSNGLAHFTCVVTCLLNVHSSLTADTGWLPHFACTRSFYDFRLVLFKEIYKVF